MTSVLQDKIFISTRPSDESDDLPKLLTDEGAQVIGFPLIQIKAAEISEEEKQCLADADPFDWIIFTSPNGVRFYFEKLQALTGSHTLKDSKQLAVIGEKTERVLQSFGYKASFVNPGSTAEDFSEPFLKHIQQKGTRPKILLPLGNLARSVIQDRLTEAARCIRINVYKTDIQEQFDEAVIKQIKEGRYDMMIFTSPSGIHSFMKLMPDLNRQEIRMACIGAITYREAAENGFEPLVTARKSSAAGMVESIINYYISKK